MKKFTLIATSALTALTLIGCGPKVNHRLSNQPNLPIISAKHNSRISIHVTDNLTAKTKNCAQGIPDTHRKPETITEAVRSLYALNQPLARTVKNALVTTFTEDGYTISDHPSHTIHFSITSLNHKSQKQVFDSLNTSYLTLKVDVYDTNNKLVWESTLHTKGAVTNALRTGIGLRPALEMAIVQAATELEQSKSLARVLGGK